MGDENSDDAPTEEYSFPPEAYKVEAKKVEGRQFITIIGLMLALYITAVGLSMIAIWWFDLPTAANELLPWITGMAGLIIGYVFGKA